MNALVVAVSSSSNGDGNEMTQNLLKRLLLGKELTDEEAKDIPHPRAELHFHVMTKCAQVSQVKSPCT